jgi:hypothetical protein
VSEALPAAGRPALLEQQATRRGALAVALLGVAALLPVARVEAGPVVCPVRRLTDVPCPGCGLTRSLTRTMHGQLRDAAAVHPAGPPLAGLLVAWALTGPAHAGTALDPRSWAGSTARRVALAVVVLAWSTWAVARVVG